MKITFATLLLLLTIAAAATQAYLLNSSEIIGQKHFVLQAGYINKNYGSQTNLNRTGTEIKVGYGVTDPLDGFLYVVPGVFPEVSGQNFQTLGLNLEYGIMKWLYGERTPVDISVISGYEKTTTLAGGAKISEADVVQFGFVIGQSLRRPAAYTTSYLGGKISFVTPSNAARWNDYELLLGLKFGLNRHLSLQAEYSYHWVQNSTFMNAGELALGLAYGN